MEKITNIDFKTIYYPDQDRNNFYLALQDFMKQFGCYYLGYICENTEKKVRIGFSSNPDWQNEYVGNHLIDDCHLWKSVVNQFILLNRKFLILPWETVKPTTYREKDIALYRADLDIGNNGVSFCTQNRKIREYFALAPDINTPNFVEYVSKNVAIIKKHIGIFRTTTLKYLKNSKNNISDS